MHVFSHMKLLSAMRTTIKRPILLDRLFGLHVKSKAIHIITLIGVLYTVPAYADLPDYDVKGLCLHQASLMIKLTHEVDQSVLKSCYQEQQHAYDTLKKLWKFVPPDIQAARDATARSNNASAGFGDYDVLLNLVMIDLQKIRDSKDNQQFQFKR